MNEKTLRVIDSVTDRAIADSKMNSEPPTGMELVEQYSRPVFGIDTRNGDSHHLKKLYASVRWLAETHRSKTSHPTEV